MPSVIYTLLIRDSNKRIHRVSGVATVAPPVANVDYISPALKLVHALRAGRNSRPLTVSVIEMSASPFQVALSPHDIAQAQAVCTI